MWENLESSLLYYGIGYSDCNRVKGKISEVNRTAVKTLSGLASMLMGVMFVMTFFVPDIRSNRMVYLVGTITSAAIFAFTVIYAKKHRGIVILLCIISSSIVYIYGMMIGLVTDPGQKTVTFMVALVLIPILFTEPPIVTVLISFIYAGIYVMLCYKYKVGVALANDVVDAIIYGILGCVVGSIKGCERVQGYLAACTLQEASQSDTLTHLNNRYSFELAKNNMPRRCKNMVGCVYIDVNGLHNLNNTEGHQAGDAMLKFVASQILETFGSELSFRIGGDEFVVFLIDPKESEIKEKIITMTEAIEEAHYHIATGLEIQYAGYHSMDNVIKSAELKMYRSKARYYEESGESRL